MKHDTCLSWGPKSNRLPDLIAFQNRLKIYCETARRKQDAIPIYRLMLPSLEGELIAVSDQIVTRRRKNARRRKAAA